MARHGGKHGTTKNISVVHDKNTHISYKPPLDTSNKDVKGRQTAYVGGKETSGAKCAPQYHGSDELEKQFEKAFLHDLPSEHAN